MSLAYVQGVSVANAGGTTLTSGGLTTTTGNNIIVIATGRITAIGCATYTSITDSKSNTYTLATSIASTTVSCDIWYSTNITGGASHTFTGLYPVSAELGLVVQEFSGVQAANALDQVATGFTTSPNPASDPTPATTTSPQLVVGGLCSGTANPAVGDGFSNYLEIDTGQGYAAMESKIVSSTGAYTANFISAAGTYAVAVATFKATTIVNNANFLEVF